MPTERKVITKPSATSKSKAHLKVAFAASECAPLAKTGGLADVVGTLPAALAKLKPAQDAVRGAVFLPKYAQIDANKLSMRRLPGKILVPMGDRIEEGQVWELLDSAAPAIYLIENDKYFKRPSLYSGPDGKDYPDNAERFIFYSRGLLEACKMLGFAPDLIHCHDWQSGLIPAYLKIIYAQDPFFARTATLFTIHNIAYQGLFPKEAVGLAGFDAKDFVPERLEYYGQLNFLKAALVYADKVSTVSPAYALEVQTPKFGGGMDGILKSRASDFIGILNGLDYGYWNPAKDPFLIHRLSGKKTSLDFFKAVCKEDLQKEARLPVNPSVPVIGIVSRLDTQKGFAKVIEVIPKLIQKKAQFQIVILGSGDLKIEAALRSLADQFPKIVALRTGFNEPLAHKIYAGSDLFLMPSEFEPCGLSQMIAMAYATVPVVTPTGGLIDTVKDFDPAEGSGNGFVAVTLESAAIEAALARALAILARKEEWRRLLNNALASRFSWEASARRYRELFQAAFQKRVR